jgi:hypothetical protein
MLVNVLAAVDQSFGADSRYAWIARLAEGCAEAKW